MRIFYVLRTSKSSQHDPSVDGLSFTLWSYAELALVLVVSSSLTLPVFLKSNQKLPKKLQHHRWIQLRSIQNEQADPPRGGREAICGTRTVESGQDEIRSVALFACPECFVNTNSC